MEKSMFKRFIIPVVVAIFISACAAPQVSLKKDVSNNLSSLDHILMISQNNLDVTVAATNPGASGLIGALVIMAIDSARRSNAEENAIYIIDELQDYDFRFVMLDSMKSEIIKTESFAYQIDTTLDKVASESSMNINFNKSQSNAVLFTAVNYRLESKNLIITARSFMYPKSNALEQYKVKPSSENTISEDNLIYKKTFIYKKQAITADNIKSSLEEGAISIANQIVMDLSHPI